MILILGGTVDAREIAGTLHNAGHAVLLTVVTDYAGELATGIPVHTGALDDEALCRLAREAKAVIDATHPFAQIISRMAIAICEELGVPYIRFEREESSLPANVHLVEDAEAAALCAVELAQGGTIFLTVGSKTLTPYITAAHAAGCRVIARVLPAEESIAECRRAGLQPRDILGMQGPTTADLDTALLRFYDARVLVTKDSGVAGGVEEKLRAADAVGIPVVVVGRPRVEYPRVVRTIEELLGAQASCLPR